VAAVKKANDPLIKEADDELRAAKEQIFSALVKDQMPVDIEDRVNAALEKSKTLNQRLYAEIFQLRSVLTLDEMKEYFKRRQDIRASLAKDATEKHKELTSR
jgi:hypothetical protein